MGGRLRDRQTQNEKKKRKSQWYLFSPVAAAGLFSPSSLLIVVRYYRRAWAHIAVFSCTVDETASECIMIQEWQS